MSKKKFIFSLVLVAVVTGAISFYEGTRFSSPKQTFNPPVSAEADTKADFSVFWQTWNTIKKDFVNANQLNDQELIYGATAGLVNSLEDPYSIFFTPKEAKTFEEELSGTIEGVGMEVGIKDDQLTVISPLKGTPAQKAGLRAGDKIIKIDDQLTQALNLEECVQAIRGPRGTKVTLIITRLDAFQEKEFTLTREKIDIPSVEWEFKQPDIAYVQIHNFYNNTGQEFSRSALEILNHPKIKRIIIDLRNNPGGYLNIVQDISGWLLKPGQVVAIEQFSSTKEDTFVAKGNSRLFNYPVVVLINEGSASGAEILAGALRDNRNVKLIGEQSFGKGSVQEPVDLQNGSMLKLTIAKWLTPAKICINETGLTPDIKVKMNQDDYQANRDPQLDKAINIIEHITLP